MTITKITNTPVDNKRDLYRHYIEARIFNKMTGELVAVENYNNLDIDRFKAELPRKYYTEIYEAGKNSLGNNITTAPKWYGGN